MSTGGLSAMRLGRMHDVMVGHIERDDVPGIVTLISRWRGVHREYGLAHFQSGQESPAEGVANED